MILSLGTAYTLSLLFNLFLRVVFSWLYRFLFFRILEECGPQSFNVQGAKSAKNKAYMGVYGGGMYSALYSVQGFPNKVE